MGDELEIDAHLTRPRRQVAHLALDRGHAGLVVQVERDALTGVIPAPHSSGPVPGCWQVLVPPGTTFQPWLESSCAAALTENGNGFVVALKLTSGLGGSEGIGP